MFIKYRREWAGGYDNWEYTELKCRGVSKKVAVEDFKEDHYNRANNDYHYRGVAVVEIRRLPKEYLKDQVATLSCTIKYHTALLERYKKMMEWK